MQKVEGSSPFSRFGKGPQRRAFCLLEATSTVAVSRNRLPNAGVQHRVRGVRDVSRGSVERIMSARFAGDFALPSGSHVGLGGVIWPSICRIGNTQGTRGVNSEGMTREVTRVFPRSGCQRRRSWSVHPGRALSAVAGSGKEQSSPSARPRRPRLEFWCRTAKRSLGRKAAAPWWRTMYGR
jgi:hypothetical protein